MRQNTHIHNHTTPHDATYPYPQSTEAPFGVSDPRRPVTNHTNSFWFAEDVDGRDKFAAQGELLNAVIAAVANMQTFEAVVDR